MAVVADLLPKVLIPPTAEELELLLKEILAAIPFIINIQQPAQIAVGEVEEVEVPDLQEDLV